MTTDPLPDDLLAKAAPRPWRIAEDDRKIQPWTDAIAIEAPNDPDGSIPSIICWMTRGGDNKANAALIVAAVNAYTGRERESAWRPIEATPQALEAIMLIRLTPTHTSARL